MQDDTLIINYFTNIASSWLKHSNWRHN